MGFDREELIHGLYQEFTGGGAKGKNGVKKSVFDMATGTLYCSEMAIKEPDARKAISYFEKRLDELKKSRKTEDFENIRFYEVAIGALKYLYNMD